MSDAGNGWHRKALADTAQLSIDHVHWPKQTVDRPLSSADCQTVCVQIVDCQDYST